MVKGHYLRRLKKMRQRICTDLDNFQNIGEGKVNVQNNGYTRPLFVLKKKKKIKFKPNHPLRGKSITSS